MIRLETPHLILLLSLLCMLLFATAVMKSEDAWSASAVHQEIPAMEIGGERAVDDRNLWYMGFALGLTIITLLTTTLLFAAPSSEQSSSLRVAILSGGVLFVASFIGLMLSWRTYAATPRPVVSGPFTAPTNWLVFGIWAAPAAFTLVYVMGYTKWFASAKELDTAEAEL